MNQRINRSFVFATVLVMCAILWWGCTTEQSAPTSPVITTKNSSLQKSGVQANITTGYPDLAIDSARLARSIKFSAKTFKPTDRKSVV